MNPVERRSLVDETEESLLKALRSGQWKSTLPGVRMLCKVLQVSNPTLQAATARLLERGILISKGPRRRLVISSDALGKLEAVTDTVEKRRRVLFLIDTPLSEVPHRTLEILSLLWMENQHWDIREHVLPFRDARRPRRQWDRLLDTEQPDHLVIFNANPALAQWAQKHQLPTVIVGGTAGGLPIPTIGSTPVPIVKQAINELARCGHSAICMPMLGIFPALRNELVKTFHATMEENGLPFEEKWNTPHSQMRSADVLSNLLTRVSSVRLPTAIIAMTWVELVTIESFLRENRLTIPRDVSIILLMDSAAAKWFQPRLSVFRHSVNRVSHTVKRWIEEGTPNSDIVVRVPGRLIHGESVRDLNA
jgi:DNA-binding LacI/PurR family transcriptional regulator